MSVKSIKDNIKNVYVNIINDVCNEDEVFLRSKDEEVMLIQKTLVSVTRTN